MKYITSLGFTLAILLSCCSEKKAPVTPEVSKELIDQHSYDNLDHFQMGEIDFIDLNLEDSLQKLISKYKTICSETSLQPLDISTVVLITSNTKQTLSLKGSFEYILAQLCLIYGAEMETNNAGKYTFYATAQGGEHQTLTIPMPQVADQLSELGQIFNSSVYFSSTGSLVVVNGQATNLKRFRKFIENRGLQNSIQIRSSTKLLNIPDGGLNTELSSLLDNSHNLTEDQTQQLLNQISSIPDTDIMTLPSIVSRLGEDADINLTNELELHLENRKLPREAHHWVGYTLHLKADCFGFNIVTDLQYVNQSVGDFDGMKMEVDTRAVIDSRNQIDTYATSNRSNIANGNISIIKIKPQGGKFNYLLLNQTVVDTTGRPIYP